MLSPCRYRVRPQPKRRLEIVRLVRDVVGSRVELTRPDRHARARRDVRHLARARRTRRRSSRSRSSTAARRATARRRRSTRYERDRPSRRSRSSRSTPTTLGDDPFALEEIGRACRAGRVSRRRPAIDAALHDLSGKLAGLPVWRLLGLGARGRRRRGRSGSAIPTTWRGGPKQRTAGSGGSS